jgi:hypothetical protein
METVMEKTFFLPSSMLKPVMVWRTSSILRIGPAIIEIDAVMEKPFFPAIVHVNNCGGARR